VTGLAGCPVVAFVGTTDAARALDFYRDVLGLALVEQTPFALVFDAHGTQLRVAIVDRVDPAPYTVLGWSVPDVAIAVRELAARGARFARYDGLDQDELGVWRSPSGARVGWFADPDGNVLSVTQR
jgi:catechol 2,3-dioxygenase-like lactoylglutathione lyase family enzyme